MHRSMASTATSCSVGRFAADEAAPPETLHVVRLQRLRLRRAAQGGLDPIAEEDDDVDDDHKVPAGSPSAHNSSSSSSSAAVAVLAVGLYKPVASSCRQGD